MKVRRRCLHCRQCRLFTLSSAWAYDVPLTYGRMLGSAWRSRTYQPWKGWQSVLRQAWGIVPFRWHRNSNEVERRTLTVNGPAVSVLLLICRWTKICHACQVHWEWSRHDWSKATFFWSARLSIVIGVPVGELNSLNSYTTSKLCYLLGGRRIWIDL